MSGTCAPDFWYAGTMAICWSPVGLASSIKGVGVPFLLLALTSAWQPDGVWAAAIRRSLRDHWRAWLVDAVVLGGWIVIYLVQLKGSDQKPLRPGAFSGVFGYMRELILDEHLRAGHSWWALELVCERELDL